MRSPRSVKVQLEALGGGLGVGGELDREDHRNVRAGRQRLVGDEDVSRPGMSGCGGLPQHAAQPCECGMIPVWR